MSVIVMGVVMPDRQVCSICGHEFEVDVGEPCSHLWSPIYAERRRRFLLGELKRLGLAKRNRYDIALQKGRP